MTSATNITADAVALQERDEFREAGWLKLIAPAKVNLHLAIGSRRPDGYHEAVSVMHALNLHDIVYARRITDLGANGETGKSQPHVRMIGCGDVAAPDVATENNLAARAIVALAETCDRPTRDKAIELRIEKNIPAQGGLGGGSTNAAATLVAAAHLWGLDPHDSRIEQTARSLGADVPFFLHGGCSVYTGTGDTFVRALAPSKQAVALVKPEGGVSTAQAYRAFDEAPVAIPTQAVKNAQEAHSATDIAPFNNLASAAESIMPELTEVRQWMSSRLGENNVLLCGSGATTFGICDDFATATSVVAQARKQGWWARATSFGSARVMAVSTN